MNTNPELFYKSYQYNYHRIKAQYLKKMLDETQMYAENIYGQDLTEDDVKEFRLVLKSDLRQNYFHSIETLFELIFALIHKNDDKYEYFDLNLQFRLTYSNWKESYKKIKDIATQDNALNFLDDVHLFSKDKITIGQYLFYIGIFRQPNFEKILKEKTIQSINSIKQVLRIIAREFMDREEYNAYKHGLRIMPSITEIMLVPLEFEIENLTFDLRDSMSFYTKMSNREDIKIVTKIFDSNRDYRMTYLCSNLIHQLIFYRRIEMKLLGDENKFSKIKYFFYSEKNIMDFNKTDVEVQDIIFTQTKEEKEKEDE